MAICDLCSTFDFRCTRKCRVLDMRFYEPYIRTVGYHHNIVYDAYGLNDWGMRVGPLYRIRLTAIKVEVCA